MKKKWADSVYNKFEPYYLVWDDVKKEDESFIWPYGLTGIRLVPMNIVYQSIYPANNDSLLIAGFSLFRNNCMKCHSVNKIGGAMGPEFNVPKNITEYWSAEDIVAFAKQPGSYRYNSRMPAIENLTNSEFNKIVLYLKYIKDHKKAD